MRDIETEEMMEELHGKIRELDKQNHQLKERVFYSNFQYLVERSCVFMFIASNIYI